MIQRDSTYDYMKGIGILLMMYLHYQGDAVPNGIDSIIHSFHVPLFFLLSGFFIKENPDVNAWLLSVRRDARRLLIPYFVTMLLICIWFWRFDIVKLRIPQNLLPLLNLFWGSGDELETVCGILHVGPMWFLIALFYARLVYKLLLLICNNCLHIRDSSAFLMLICGCITLLSNWLYDYLYPLAWNPFPGLSAMLFISIGHFLKLHIGKIEVQRWYYVIPIILVWGISLLCSNTNVRTCTYSCFPMSILGACCGSIFVYAVSVGFKHLEFCAPIKVCLSPLLWVGRYSMVVLCMHAIDLAGLTNYVILIFSNMLPSVAVLKTSIVINYLIVLLVSYVITKTPFLKKIYC